MSHHESLREHEALKREGGGGKDEEGEEREEGGGRREEEDRSGGGTFRWARHLACSLAGGGQRLDGRPTNQPISQDSRNRMRSTITSLTSGSTPSRAHSSRTASLSIDMRFERLASRAMAL